MGVGIVLRPDLEELLTLSLDCLARLVSLPGDRATSIHLEGLLRGRVKRWLSPLEQWGLSLGERPLVPPI